MNVHLKYCIFAACGVVASVLLGLFVNRNAYIITALCGIWSMWHFFGWVAQVPTKPGPTSKEVFRSFYEDDPNQPSDKES